MKSIKITELESAKLKAWSLQFLGTINKSKFVEIASWSRSHVIKFGPQTEGQS